MARYWLSIGALALAGCASTGDAGLADAAEDAAFDMPWSGDTADPRDARPAPTVILDEAAAARLRANSGITLQWISWDNRGKALVGEDARGVWTIDAEQKARRGQGRVSVEGVITEIGEDYFIADALIEIEDAPDAGRQCSQRKPWRFAITQNRKYWRLREFEWCDGLTDYIDVYF